MKPVLLRELTDNQIWDVAKGVDLLVAVRKCIALATQMPDDAEVSLVRGRNELGVAFDAHTINVFYPQTKMRIDGEFTAEELRMRLRELDAIERGEDPKKLGTVKK